MTMPKADVERVLFSLGFQVDPLRRGNSYFLNVTPPWRITAYGWEEGNFFDRTTDPDNFREVSLTLQGKGTRYRFKSITGLEQHAPEVITELRRVSANEDLLKCPTCKIRYVHAKEPLPSQRRFKPFLSCDGMQVEGSGKRKRIPCKGISTALPALVVHR